MTTEESQTEKRREIPYKGWIQAVGLFLALGASLATLASVWLQIRKTAPQLDAIIESVQNLTNLPQIPQLKADFNFDGRPVSDLWQVRLRLLNSGERTIIGEGPQKNIVKDAIIVAVADGFELLQLQTDSADFPNEVKKTDSSHFAVNFLQWRSGEATNLTLYLERKNAGQTRPAFYSEERYLLDGDVTVVDACASPPKPKKPLLDRIPPPAATALRSLSIVVNGSLGIICVVLSLMAGVEVIQYARWHRKHYAAFAEFVKKDFPNFAKNLNAKSPSLIGSFVWKTFPGPKPKSTSLLFEGERQKWSYGVFFLAMALVAIACAAGVTGLLII